MKKIILPVLFGIFIGGISSRLLNDFLNPEFVLNQEIVLDSSIKKNKYISSVSGTDQCKTPKNPSQPENGDCEIEISTYDTGYTIIKNGDTCYQDTYKLLSIEKIKFNEEIEILAPALSLDRKSINCPK